MKNKYFIYKNNNLIKAALLIQIIIVSSCDQNNNHSTSKLYSHGIEINIDNYKPDDIVYYSEIFDDYEIIPLETTKESLIGRVESVRFCRNNIVILDQLYTKAVFLFDLNGNFIRRIGTLGKGPGEYINPSAISTDDEKGQIAIYDGMADQVLLYNIDGSYIKTIPLKQNIGATSIELFDDKIYAGYTIDPGQEYLLDIIDENGDLVEQLISNENKDGYSDPNNNSVSTIFLRKNNTLKFRCSSINTVFNIKNNSLQPIIQLTSRELKSYAESYSKSENIAITAKKKLDMKDVHDGKYELFSYVEANNLSIMEYKTGMQVHLLFYDTKTGIIKSTTMQNFKDDIINRTSAISGYFYTVYQDKIVAVSGNGFVLKELLKKIKSGEITSPTHDLSNLDIDSNPCIIMYKCKS